MTPDFNKAAIKASEILIKHNISTAPIDPMPILKKTPGVLVMTFAEMSDKVNMDRKNLIGMFGCENQDAVTTVYLVEGEKRYLVTYNQQLPFGVLQRALARELGHIVLGHDGTRPESVRQEEATCFAHHLLCPRALVHSIQATGIRLTKEVVGSMTGFSAHCITCIRKTPATNVPPELNRIVRDQFMPYATNFFEFQQYASLKDGSAIMDFGTFMDGYDE